MAHSSHSSRLHLVVPLASLGLLGLTFLLGSSIILNVVCAIALIAAVFAAVHHAEVVAHKVGEPFGTLILALAVTVIEVALIVSMMMAGGVDAATLPRDTLYAAIMIICGGVLGLCLVVGALRHHEQIFQFDGVQAGLVTLIALSGLTMVLPQFTTTTPGPTYSPSQLAFAATASLVLWSLFVFVQTVRHRGYFLPANGEEDETHPAEPPTLAQTWSSLGLLLVALVAVVGLAKSLSPSIEAGIARVGAPKAVLGIVIALLVLLPETVAAVKAALANRLQTSMNLAIGSALACVGLTVPAVAVASQFIGIQPAFGLNPMAMVQLALTFLVCTVTLSSGRTNLMLGSVHLVLFAAFLFLTLVP